MPKRRGQQVSLKADLSPRRNRSSGGVHLAERKNKATAPDQPSRIVVNVLLCLLLAGMILGVFGGVLRYPFINYDDGVYVFENPHVSSGLNWANVRWAFTAVTAANWHPVTWISHALDCQLFGLTAAGHHGTNLALHVLNSVLLFLLLAKATGARWRSMMVAAIFALHPLSVESVAWIAERKNLLCTLFFFLALGAYGWYARRPGIVRYLSALLFFALGLASKPMVVTLPFVLLLIDFWPLGRIADWSQPSTFFPVPQRTSVQLVLEKLPLLALSVASAAVTLVAQKRGDALASIQGWPFGWRVANAFHAYATYLWKAFVPISLAPFYPGMALHAVDAWRIALAIGFVLTAGWAGWKLSRGRPYVVTGSLWFLGTLIPVIGIVQVGSQSMADRYTYIPLIGIFVTIVWGTWEIARHYRFGTRWLAGAAILALGILSVLTWRQTGYWRSSDVLWAHALKVTPSNFVAEDNLGTSLLSLGREDDAYLHFQKATMTRPEDPVALLNIGRYLEKHRQYQKAIAAFQVVANTSRVPDELAGAYRGLGVSKAQLGDLANARTDFVHALQLTSHPETEFYNLSLLETAEAITQTSRSLAAHPTAQGYMQLGQLLQEQRRIPDAQTAYRNALRLDPRLAAAKVALKTLAAGD